MSTFQTQNIESTTGGAPNFSQGLTVGGTNLSSLVTLTEYYSQAGTPSSPANGALWWNGTSARQYAGGAWRVLNVSGPSFLGNKALFFRGTSISTVSIPTLGNATSFGTTSATSYSALSDGSRAVTGLTSNMEYVTIATAGNGTNFGNLSVARQYTCGASNMERGLFAGGAIDLSDTDYGRIDYITIATPGNATFFGNLGTNLASVASVSSDTRAVFSNSPQWAPYLASVIATGLLYVTFATLGNAVTFGNVTQSRGWYAGATDKTYGVFGGGGMEEPYSGSVVVYNNIDRITIATTGNAVDFGDLTVARNGLGATSNGQRAVFVGGKTLSTNSNVIDYVTIATPGNATDFGDVSAAGLWYSGCSGN